MKAACLEGVEEVGSRQSSVGSYPNPVIGRTTFNILLSEPSVVNLVVFNSLEQLVAIIVDEILEKGAHQVTWNAEDQNPGIYFYRLQTESGSFIGKIVVAR